jgi:hypothetical protein
MSAIGARVTAFTVEKSCSATVSSGTLPHTRTALK